MSDSMEACLRCRYAVKMEGVSGCLECHRHPSQVAGIDGDGAAVSAFPAVDPSEWCGEYVERRCV